MQIFLSYANEQRAVADELALALRERDHEVFLDRDDLESGTGYNTHIEKAIKEADLMVFLISPQSVEPGRYTLTELAFARKHWRTANRKLVPVMVKPTDMSLIPAFVKSVNIVIPQGNVVAETAAAVDEQRGLEYAVTVGMKVSAIAVAFGLLSYFSFDDYGKAYLDYPAPIIRRWVAPEVGLLFSVPIGIALWVWGLRRWWAFAIPVIIVTMCYWSIAPSIGELTQGLSRDTTKSQVYIDAQKVSDKLTDPSNKKIVETIRDDVIKYTTASRRIVLGLISGAVMALGSMISLGLVMPQFRSVFRWMIVLAAGAVISGIDAAIVLEGGVDQFSRGKAMLLIIVWQVVFGFLVGYWLARGRTTWSG